MSVVAIDTLINVPAGSLQSIAYQTTMDTLYAGGEAFPVPDDFSDVLYLAPGTGYVKRVVDYITVGREPERHVQLAFRKTYELIDVVLAEGSR